MGLITGTLRLQQLNDAKHDMEFKMQEITQKKLRISGNLCEVAEHVTDASIQGKDSPEMKKLEERKIQLEAIEKKLDAQMAQYNNKLSAIQTEMESAKKIVESNSQSSFTYGGRT